MRRVGRSYRSKLDSTSTAHPLSQLTLSLRAPGRSPAFSGEMSKCAERRGIFIPFSPSPVRERCEKSYDDHS